ncbi:MAG TPA: hypothetical protein DCQ92_03315 [Verrucomicrobia subdivision 3 bacterium]|nr:hypothetical protein [Limisphaerales bacterium]
MKWWKHLSAIAIYLFQRRWWHFIAATRAEHPDNFLQQITCLQEKLSTLSPREIRRFAEFYEGQRNQTFAPELWYAAKIITSNFAETSFAVLQHFIVLRGREDFLKILSSPENLAAHTLPKNVDREVVRNTCRKVYTEKTGKPLTASLLASVRIIPFLINIR